MTNEIKIGQRFDVFEVLPTIRYAGIEPGEHVVTNEIDESINYVIHTCKVHNTKALLVNSQLDTIYPEIKKVGSLIIKSLK